jgi:hypothetical protein
MERHQGIWDEFVRFEEPDTTALGEYFTISIVSRM